MQYKNLRLVLLALPVFLFAPNYSIQFIALVIILIITLSLCYAVASRFSLHAVRANTIQRTYKKEFVEIRVTIHNHGLLPLHQIFFSDTHGSLETDANDKVLVSLLRMQSKLELVYKVKGSERGEYPIGPLMAKGADPLGLFPWKKEFREKESVIIYPRVFAMHIKDKNGLPCGSLPSNNPVFEDISNYKSIREYIPGDDLRRINWKVSARLGSLHTMQFLPSMRYIAVILLNLNLEMYPIKHRYALIEAAIETAASLVYHSISQKQETSLICTGILDNVRQTISFPSRKDEGHAVAILETLSRIIPDNTGTDMFNLILDAGIKLPWNCRIQYIGPQPDGTQMYSLHVLKNKGYFPELFIVTEKRETIHSGMPVYYYHNLQSDGGYHA